MTSVVSFPKIKDELTLDEMIGCIKNTITLKEGVFVAFHENGNLCVLNFGDMTAMKALWLAEQLRMHAIEADFPLEECYDE